MHLGFAGLGLMGTPMATNLHHAGAALTVYNRSPGPLARMQALGVSIAQSPHQLFSACDVVILMLANDAAVDHVLARGGPAFGGRVRDRLIINMGTHEPSWSRRLSRDITAVGGAFVEATVSGSRGPAQAGELVVMCAGEAEAVTRAKSILAPLCRDVVVVGQVPSATAMKLAVNLYLIASVAALAEAAHLATRSGLDLNQFAGVIAAGALGSDVARTKLDKMVRRDFSPQAAIGDVVKNARLVSRAARLVGADVPLLEESKARFESIQAHLGDALDMAAILTSYEGSGATSA